ncbi:DNA polymerase III subunit alpha [Paenibacillus polymyxa]|uniref:DNA polymerase III subunit alpha n=1 Tax=Paenibacillus polymyxa TaxID=1406 RepID=UPI0001E6C920|nr:DNA polymerase III subunit alpha [Paenibacillus polymyxa]WPQ59737.1 DNA polymerase III subunit alpha [Paenibacillus polymyxa]
MCKLKSHMIEIPASNTGVGDFYDAELNGFNVMISNNGIHVHTVDAKDVMCVFTGRRKLKAIVEKKEDGLAKLQIVDDYFVDMLGLEAEVGEFYNVEYKENNLILMKEQIVVGIVLAVDVAPLFRNKMKRKAVVRKVQNGVAILQIIRWADLHRHSGYSLLDGGSKISDIVRKTEYAGAITDHGAMFGTLEYYKQMRKAGKLPILGFEAYAETIQGEKKGNHLLLLAKNEEGFKNLVKLTSKSQENFFRKPHVNYDMLGTYGKGIISSTSCMGSEVSQLLLKNKYEDAKYVAKALAEIFGKEDYYVELQRHGFDEERIVNPQLIQIARELDLKIIGTTDSHYTEKEDAYDHEVLLCIGTVKKMSDYDRMQFPGTGYHLHTSDEVEELFSDIPEALENTLEIAEKCSGLTLEMNKVYMPKFNVPAPFVNEMDYLKHLAWQGFKERFEGTEKDNEEYRERLTFELEVIKGMGFPGYFLIVGDFVDFAKRKGILVGPGRGSVVGALTAYCLHITDLDPIPLGLLFERFLNPDRVSMPDIDMDFPDDRREEVIDYVKNKYGEHAVSRIITFGTMAARAAIKDVGRVLDYPVSMTAKIAKSIPAVPKMTIKKAFKESPEFLKMYETEADVKKIVDIAMKLEGLPRHASMHACGVVIAPSSISDYIPEILMENKETKLKERTTQFNMAECEEMGILKMDFLGLRTMTVISKSLSNVNPRRIREGKKPLHYLDIPLNDKRVYQDIAKGESYGVFQLESGGMRSFMKELFADALQTGENTMELFERLIAGVSLYRPGPLDYIPDYLKNMQNPENIQYDHPKLKSILEFTYGVIVYQEQCMFIVRELADFTKGEADNVRKAFSKKKEKMIKPLGEKFVAGCLKKGISQEVAERIWGKMRKFGEYAFNKSHAGAYSVLSVVTAWLKFYYPVEFMTAVLNSYINKADKLKLFLSVVKKMKIEILPPDVDRSGQMFTVDGDRIRFGLQGIKGLGKASENVIEERAANGEFEDFQDLAERMAKHSKVDKKILEAMVYSGSVDSFPGTRSAKLEVLDKILASASDEKKMHNSGQMDLFSMYEEFKVYKKIVIPDKKEFHKKFKLEKEKEYAGFYISEHPLDEYASYFAREGVYEIGFIKHEEDEDETIEVEGEVFGGDTNYDGEVVKVAGIITDLKTFYTKRDQKELKVFTLEDRTGEMKVVCFADRIDANREKIVEGKVVMIQGQVKVDDYDTQIIVKNMFDIEQIAKSEKPKSIWVKSHNQKQVKSLFNFVKENKGNLPVYVLYQGQAYQSKHSFDLNYANFAKLQDMFGHNVKVLYA